MNHEINAENLGPIERLTVKFNDYGVTVLSAPNGSGKSIFADACAKLASGKGRLPLRDGSRRGEVNGFGATITIGASTRHNGEFEVCHLEGRFDLAELVDPKLKSPEAADKRRIRALVGLTGVKADTALFKAHGAFGDFDHVVAPDSCNTDDLVEMAAKVKRDYEAAARMMENKAEKEFGTASGLYKAAESVDTSAQSDAAELQDAYDAARDEVTRLTEQAANYEHFAGRAQRAKQQLAEIEKCYSGLSVSAAKDSLSVATNAALAQSTVVAKLEEQLREERLKLERCDDRVERAEADVKAAVEHERMTEAARKAIDDMAGVEMPSDESQAAAAQAVRQAREALEQGVRIRDALKQKSLADQHKEAALDARRRAELYREAAGLTDEVLSSAIRCDEMRVASVDGEARLVVDHPKRGKNVPFHELSEGERWRIAINLGADQVGEGGLLVIPQDAWESLDVFTRPVIDQRGKERKVYILAPEATRHADDGKEIVCRGYEHSTAG